jgi:hypothetical protein
MKRLATTSTLLTIVLSLQSLMAADFPSLLSQIPDDSNTITLIDVEAILKSPIAKAQGWDKRFREGNADRPAYFPPEASKVVIASQIDMLRDFHSIWQAAVIDMKENVDLDQVARAEGGYTDDVGKVKVVWAPSDAYFLAASPTTLGLLTPANRQSIGRWSDQLQTARSGRLSEFLKSASEEPSNGSQILIALDAENVVQPHRVRGRLQDSDSSKILNIEETAQLLSSLKGLTLRIRLTDKAEADVNIEFGRPVKLSPVVAKGLFIQALDTMGMSLPGTDGLKCSVSGMTINLTGDMDPDALRRVLSLTEMQTTKFSSLKEEKIEESSASDVAQLSLAYFQSIESMLKDLRKRAKSSGTNNDAVWISRYAAKIDRLPILHVDDELLEYGEKLSETLHIMSGSRRMSTLEGSVASRSERSNAGVSTDNYGYGYGAYNYTSPSEASRNAGNARLNAHAQGSAVQIQGWTLIDEATLEIRKAMTKKYTIEF